MFYVDVTLLGSNCYWETEEKEVEINIKKAISEAEMSANVSKILMKQQEIENQMCMAREKSLAKTNFYRWMFRSFFSLKDMNMVL